MILLYVGAKVLVESMTIDIDGLSVGSWTVERTSRGEYLEGGGALWLKDRLAVDAGMMAISKLPATILLAVRPEIDEKVNKTLVPDYVKQTNDMIMKMWPVLRQRADAAVTPGGTRGAKRGREDEGPGTDESTRRRC